jgi:hypothetical protein
MSFGHTININKNQIADEFGKVTLIKIPKLKGKAVMIASRYVDNDSFWINPNWDYKILSGKDYRNDYATWSAEELLEAFNYDSDEKESYLIVKHPEKIESEIDIDFN